jgi:nitrate/TMAO reductase-like tetraheme cytochrome c subunit
MVPHQQSPWNTGFRLVIALTPIVALVSFFLVGCQNKPAPPVTPASTSNLKAPTSAIPDLMAAKEIKVGGRALFSDWPKEKPDMVLMITGQSYGFLSPCGCSRPQTGGLERRFNVVQSLKAKGWDVVGVDVGDLAPVPGKGLTEQAVKKYTFMMHSLQAMGYVATGVGLTEVQNDLLQLLGKYTLNNGGKNPIVLSGNVLAGVERDKTDKTKVLKSVPREQYFKVPDGRPMIEDVQLVTDKAVSLGIVGMAAPSIAASIVEANPTYDFEALATAMPKALKKLNDAKTKPELKVLLLQGSLIEAMQAAKDYPEFQVIVCTSDGGDSEAPLFPKGFPENKPTTQIIQMGHKGKNVGLLGVFKTANGLDLRYQLVPLGEEFLTPEKPVDLAKDNAVLQLLEGYTAEVKKDDLLVKFSEKLKAKHQAQVANDTKYIGSAACAKCHAAEYAKWKDTKHSHAYEALEKYATRPSLRQYDPECVVCHTVGFEYKTGFVSKEKTPELMHNGCENCHGPGSAHAEKPKDKDLLKALAPWKLKPEDKLPSLEVLKKIAETPEKDRGKVEIPNSLQRLAIAIDGQVCRKCHDLDNDPKFDIWTYLPKIYHSGLKDDGLPGK